MLTVTFLKQNCPVTYYCPQPCCHTGDEREMAFSFDASTGIATCPTDWSGSSKLEVLQEKGH